MKNHAYLALSALIFGCTAASAGAATTVPTLGAQAEGVAPAALETAATPEEDSEAPANATETTEAAEAEAAPAKIDLGAIDGVETSRRDEEGGAAPLPISEEGIEIPDSALLEETMLPADTANPAPITQGSADGLRQTIRIRELKTLTLRDPQVQAELDRARHTATPAGWRAAMRNHYTLLYKKIIAQDSKLKEPVEKELRAKLADLEQHRVRPTTLIEAIPELPGSRTADYLAPDSVTIIERPTVNPRTLIDESDPRR